MERLSAFMVTHNCIVKGEPFVESILQLNKHIKEIIVVDRMSTDGTTSVLRQLPCKVLSSTSEQPYELFQRVCNNDIVLMVDPNEVFDYSLLESLVDFILSYENVRNVSLPRIEVTYNFQKISWNTHMVHRVFPKQSKNWKRIDVTTNKTHLRKMYQFGIKSGFLWAFRDNFRDNWYNRASLKDVSYLPPNHYMSHVSMDIEDVEDCRNDDLWKSTKTPLHIPDILRNLVGDIKYNPMKNLRRKN